ncbi:MAG TPA: XRE family transcriptional regulator [Aeromonas salmonicida]|uniref:2TM domain-containing protein n=1 Tax=Aeromonas salmonicida TaxID=645 RepID=UPI000E97B21E|nr:2TM domain-containing protein [Aeromonas salmonicida]VFB11460.1 helix-turn-helix domain-containing protein [Aeromonas salmonicida]HAT04244.1 XRE family transcriptional regulator [Aeromonas salmonicida]HBL05103.1 XRE family transcriptional regulator [Aeromonas salmonicida]
MIVRKLRLQRGWSQDQLATLTGLSVRTIQRIEQGQQPGLESLKALASVFELDVAQLDGTQQQEREMRGNETMGQERVQVSAEERAAMGYVEGLKGFYYHIFSYVLVICGLFVINYLSNPDYIWAWWPALGWGLGLISHAINLFQPFKLFGPEWERRQIEKRLGRKL